MRQEAGTAKRAEEGTRENQSGKGGKKEQEHTDFQEGLEKHHDHEHGREQKEDLYVGFLPPMA